MARDPRFTADEWALLGAAPLAAATAVALAQDDDGDREAEALLAAWQAFALAPEGPLVGAIAADHDPEHAELTPPPGPFEEFAIDQCRAADALLAARASAAERGAYQRFIVGLATAVAAAGRSGEMRGFGGMADSYEERSVIIRIRQAFGVPDHT